jgi:hypothetical protein
MKGNERGINWNAWERKGMKGNARGMNWDGGE